MEKLTNVDDYVVCLCLQTAILKDGYHRHIWNQKNIEKLRAVWPPAVVNNHLIRRILRIRQIRNNAINRNSKSFH